MRHCPSAISQPFIETLERSLGWRQSLDGCAALFLDAKDAELRVAGLSANKRATLRRAAEAIVSGAISEAMREQQYSEEAVELLQRITGIGPWTASVILLRRLGRIDVFPGNDSGVRAKPRAFRRQARERRARRRATGIAARDVAFLLAPRTSRDTR